MKNIGACYSGGNCIFTVWAPEKENITLQLLEPLAQKIPMSRTGYGYFTATVEDLPPDARYLLIPNGAEPTPDPASHYQPEGVHGPSQVVDHSTFSWTDAAWRGLPLKDLILYEIHVGCFTEEGTFEAIIPRLDVLMETGINAIELMPVSQFPGGRNWGYDGVYPYAVQNSYGGPEGLKKLVDACHSKGMAVFLDVVYNHLGPEGNYFGRFAPYFTGKYPTPWGAALNFDGEWADGVRDYFADNMLHWFKTYHIDGLRVDAIHMVFDMSAVHFWEYATNKVRQLQQELGRPLHLIAESDLNSPKVVLPPAQGGYGFDGQWLDDFHHALLVLLYAEDKLRYEDFGSMEQLAKAYKEGFVLSGDFVKFRKRKYGASSAALPGDKFVVFNQNHDQVGNRVQGERLSVLLDFERQKLAAAAILLSPYVPMLFMGEEYAEEAPFFYFISHGDEELVKAVQEGRKKEFAAFHWKQEPPDPQAEETFLRSKLNWHQRHEGKNGTMHRWYKTLIAMRRHPALANTNKDALTVDVFEEWGLAIYRKDEANMENMLCLFNFSEDKLFYKLPGEAGIWGVMLNAKDPQWLAGDATGGPPLPAEMVAGEGFFLAGHTAVVLKHKPAQI